MKTESIIVGRPVIVAVIVTILVLLIVVFYSTFLAASLEFNESVRVRVLRQTHPEATPACAVLYRSVFPYGWLAVLVAALWGFSILKKGACGLVTIICYAGVFANVSVFWLVFTLFAFYLQNQTFWVGQG